MANAYTGTSAFSNIVQTAYDRLVGFKLRAAPVHRDLVDVRPRQQAMPGSSVVLSLYQDLATATSSLTETVDPDAVSLGNPTQITLTPLEYGNAVLRTRLVSLFALSDVDPAIANIVAYNLLDSVDSLVLTQLVAGTNVIREAGGSMTINSGANSAITSTDTLQSRDCRAAVTKLRVNKAVPRRGSMYAAYIHPDVAYDLKSESANIAGWRAPQVYSGPDNVWAGEIGEYEGAFWIETPRANNDTSGSASTRVFYTLVVGQEALAEALTEEFHTVVGLPIDKLMRARPIGWYGVAGWNIYRQEALFQIRTTSSIHTT